jgi:murein DD-endopeptidase MepM/ murein hydrolase activator NlpD
VTARSSDPSPDTGLRRRARLLGCALSIGLVAVVAPPVFADEDDARELNERTEQLDEDLNQANSNLDEVSSRLVKATGALRQAQSKLDLAQRELADTRGELTAARSLDDQMQAELEQAEQELADAEIAVEQTERRMERLRQEISDLVVTSYQYGSPGMASLDVILDGGDPNELSENLALADSVVGAQALTLDQLTADEVLLEVEKERVEELRDEVATKREAAAENLTRKIELTRQAVQQAAAVREIVATRSQAQQRAAKAKQIELDRIARLEATRERVQTMLEKLAAQDQPGPVVSAESNGFLSWPVTGGYVSSPYGMRMHPILRVYKLHDGTDFGLGCGEPVYAAAAGEVVSAYYDAAYGNRVILANGTVNGNGLSTSYNHLTSDTVVVGKTVKRGELIGYVGTTGYSTGCHLHFMVYRNGATTDPMSWLS